MICAMVLAAGESKRMGKPKMLLPFGGKTIIEHVVENVCYSQVDKILVVLGSHRQEIFEKIAHRAVFTAINPRYPDGMLSSIQTGFRSVPPETTAVVICLGDQPLIPSSVIDALIEAFLKTKKGIVLPTYQGKRGHPILIDMKYTNEVQDISPKIGLRSLVHSHPQDIQEVEVDTPQILKDIDKPEDYARELEKKEEG